MGLKKSAQRQVTCTERVTDEVIEAGVRSWTAYRLS